MLLVSTPTTVVFLRKRLQTTRLHKVKKNIETENIIEETLGEGEKLEFKNN